MSVRECVCERAEEGRLICGRRSVRARTCVSGKCGWVCVCVLGGGTDDPDHACLGLGLIERVEILAQCADDRLIPAPSSINRGRTLHVPIDRSARTSHQPQRPVVTCCALYILRCTLCAAKACRVSDRLTRPYDRQSHTVGTTVLYQPQLLSSVRCTNCASVSHTAGTL